MKRSADMEGLSGRERRIVKRMDRLVLNEQLGAAADEQEGFENTAMMKRRYAERMWHCRMWFLRIVKGDVE